MTTVMRHPAQETTFRRCVRGRKGQVVKTLVFPPREVVDLDGRELEAVAGDLDKALVEVIKDDRGRPRIKQRDPAVAEPWDSAPEEDQEAIAVGSRR